MASAPGGGGGYLRAFSPRMILSGPLGLSVCKELAMIRRSCMRRTKRGVEFPPPRPLPHK